MIEGHVKKIHHKKEELTDTFKRAGFILHEVVLEIQDGSRD